FTSSLTVVQFSIATLLIIASLIIGLQIRYLSNRPLGFNKTEVISIPIGSGINPETALSQMRNELSQQPWVESVTGADINLGKGRDGSTSTSRFGFEYEGQQIYTNYLRIDYDYIKTLDIK